MAARSWGEERTGYDGPAGMRLPSGVMKMFSGTRWWWWLHNILIVLTATELYTLKWLMVNFMFCEIYLNLKEKGERQYCFVEVKKFPTTTSE